MWILTVYEWCSKYWECCTSHSKHSILSCYRKCDINGTQFIQCEPKYFCVSSKVHRRWSLHQISAPEKTVPHKFNNFLYKLCNSFLVSQMPRSNLFLQRTCRFNLEKSFDVNILLPLTYLDHSNIRYILLYSLYTETILFLKSKEIKKAYGTRITSRWCQIG